MNIKLIVIILTHRQGLHPVQHWDYAETEKDALKIYDRRHSTSSLKGFVLNDKFYSVTGWEDFKAFFADMSQLK